MYLNSGFSLVADSHTQSGETYTFNLAAGTVELPAKEIREIVVLPDAPSKKIVVSTQASEMNPPQAVLASAAAREGVDALLVKSVAKIESGMRQEAISRKGAIGLMQLMPGTAAELGVNAAKADENASGGARYLRALLERYGYNPVLALAAYNAGPKAVARYGGIPPYYETRTYVVRVLKEYERQLKLSALNPSSMTASNLSKTPSATN